MSNISSQQTIFREEVLYILSLDIFLDKIEKQSSRYPMAVFSPSAKKIVNRNTYHEISKLYDKLEFKQKLLLFQDVLKFYNYNPWKKY